MTADTYPKPRLNGIIISCLYIDDLLAFNVKSYRVIVFNFGFQYGDKLYNHNALIESSSAVYGLTFAWYVIPSCVRKNPSKNTVKHVK